MIACAAGSKETSVELLSEGGVEAVPVPLGIRSALCLSDAQVEELARLVMAAEGHCGVPQEVEWALDRSGRLFLLQSRPLHASSEWIEQEEAPREVEGHPRLLTGASASTGCGSGPVFLSFGPEDFGVSRGCGSRGAPLPPAVRPGHGPGVRHRGGHRRSHRAHGFPREGIRHPRGAGHAQGDDTLRNGDVVTVDGNRGAVYEGRAEGLLAERSEQVPRGCRARPFTLFWPMFPATS